MADDDDDIATPRTDAFVAALPPLIIPAEASREVQMMFAQQARILMAAWAAYARALEKELEKKIWTH